MAQNREVWRDEREAFAQQYDITGFKKKRRVGPDVKDILDL